MSTVKKIRFTIPHYIPEDAHEFFYCEPPDESTPYPYHEGERNLMYAVLWRALEDAIQPYFPLEIRMDAREWIRSNEIDDFTYLDLCHQLDLDPNVIRGLIKSYDYPVITDEISTRQPSSKRKQRSKKPRKISQGLIGATFTYSG